MKEGWISDTDYLIVFDDTEVDRMTEAYGIGTWLPGFTLTGIVGWDDFVVTDGDGRTFRVPTVPVAPTELEPFDVPRNPDLLKSDQRYVGKIKWYTTPIVFGGDPSSEDNMIWIDIAKHQDLVQWWNRKYREVKGQQEANKPFDRD